MKLKTSILLSRKYGLLYQALSKHKLCKRRYCYQERYTFISSFA